MGGLLVALTDNIYNIGAGRDFIVFNDGELSMEPVTAEDLEPVAIAPGSPCASAAWSANCNWYFIIGNDVVVLLNTHTNRGFLCRKKSAMFIEMFMNAPRKGKKKPS